MASSRKQRSGLELIPPSDVAQVLTEQFALLIAVWNTGDITAEELDRLTRVRKILLEPFETRQWPVNPAKQPKAA